MHLISLAQPHPVADGVTLVLPHVEVRAIRVEKRQLVLYHVPVLEEQRNAHLPLLRPQKRLFFRCAVRRSVQHLVDLRDIRIAVGVQHLQPVLEAAHLREDTADLLVIRVVDEPDRRYPDVPFQLFEVGLRNFKNIFVALFEVFDTGERPVLELGQVR